MTLRSNKRVLALGAAVIALVGVLSVNASAVTPTYSAVAWIFVGTANQCAPAPAGNKIVFSGWLNGMGLPDDGTANPGGGTAHQGLVLNKNGPTPNCSAAGASIVGWTTGTLSALGFDYRLGGHCGAGAPRFNVTDNLNNTYFFGCNGGTPSAAPQDPANWTRVTFDQTNAPPGFVFGVGGTTVMSIDIVFDEGTDTPSPDGNAPAGVGLATIDNIRINHTLITKKAGNPILP
jgi:hypothetical protein